MSTHVSSGQNRKVNSSVGRLLLSACLVILIIILSICTSTIVAASPSMRPVTIGQQCNDWPLANFDYANTRNATCSNISSHNVNQLGVAWSFKVVGMTKNGALATSPIVVNNTVYLQDLASNVYVIDLQTGKLKWEKLYNDPNGGPNGLAIDDGMVFATSNMQTVVALDASTGRQLWSWRIPYPDTQGIDQQLTPYNGTIYVSTTPNPSISRSYVAGGIGTIYALNEWNGNMKWSFDTVKDGYLWGHPDINSGGGAWLPPGIDTRSGATYWGVGNPAPYPGTSQYPNGSSRPGPNLYTESEISLDSSGQLRWYNQIKPHDNFDLDFQTSPILTTATMNGIKKGVAIGSGKTGYVVAFDRQTGATLWKTRVGMHQNDWTQYIPPGKVITVFPGTLGGTETPMSFADGVIFAAVNNVPSKWSATKQVVKASSQISKGNSELYAIDVNTGNVLWKTEMKVPDFGATTVVGDLVFTANYKGLVMAFNRYTGQHVWSWQAPDGINGFMSVAGNTLLIPAGVGNNPVLVALRLGA